MVDDHFAFDPEWNITWTNAGRTHTREYSLTIDTPADTCQRFVNTASISQTGQTSSASVRICASGEDGQPNVFERLVTTGASAGIIPAIAGLLLLGGVLLVLRHRRRPETM